MPREPPTHTGVGADTVVGHDSPSFSLGRGDAAGVSCVPVPLSEPDVLFRAAPTRTGVPVTAPA